MHGWFLLCILVTRRSGSLPDFVDNSPFWLVTRLRTWISRSPLVDTSNACLCMWFGKLFIRLLSPGYVSNFAYVYDSISSFHSLIFTRTCKQFLLTHIICKIKIKKEIFCVHSVFCSCRAMFTCLNVREFRQLTSFRCMRKQFHIRSYI